jgi:high affinity Mn2+ porin
MKVGWGVLALVLTASVAHGQEPRPDAPRWDWGFQVTTITQFAPSFDSPYEGRNSFLNEGSGKPATTFVPTLFLAARLWKSAWISVQPEFSDGSGVGGGTGVAAYANQDVLRTTTLAGKPYLARAFIQQAIPLGASVTESEDPPVAEEKFLPSGNHLFGAPGRRRLEITFGKMSLPDFYDAADFGREAHHGLMSWGLVNTGSWDYAADTRGYTWGLTVAYEGGPLAVRAGTYAMPEVANGATYDHHFSKAHAENLELEWTFDPANRGAVRLLGYVNHANMGSYDESLALAASTGGTPDITHTRQEGRKKYGLSLNAQRLLTPDLGAFLRLGWSDGNTETFAYTEIDRDAVLGLFHGGAPWKRPDDRVIVAVAMDGLSGPHRRYLEAGGLGFQLGDGRLNYGFETVFELDYAAQITKAVSIGLDGQYVANPGYNKDRGPITIYGIRLHAGF